jgi:hypothetical protein
MLRVSEMFLESTKRVDLIDWREHREFGSSADITVRAIEQNPIPLLIA